MTIINQAELAQLSRLDQILMWSIVSINASNLDGRNNFISDNAAIREESKDYISWEVMQDDDGNGRFMFNALLPIVNPHPLQDKVSILSTVYSYSPYDPNLITEDGILGYGWGVPPIPEWIDTVEKLLAYVAVLGSKIVKLAPLVKGSPDFVASIKQQYWANCQYQITNSAYGSEMIITGYLTIDWRTYMRGGSLIRCLTPNPLHGSPMNCNFPDLVGHWGVPEEDIDLDLPVEDIINSVPNVGVKIPRGGFIFTTENDSAEELIDSYSQRYFIDDALPDWYLDALNNPPHIKIYRTGIGDHKVTSKTPKIIESLPICIEQDFSVMSYGNTRLSDVLRN